MLFQGCPALTQQQQNNRNSHDKERIRFAGVKILFYAPSLGVGTEEEGLDDDGCGAPTGRPPLLARGSGSCLVVFLHVHIGVVVVVVVIARRWW